MKMSSSSQRQPLFGCWIGLLVSCFFFSSLPQSTHALVAFTSPDELEGAVDMYLSQQPINLTLLQGKYGPIEYWDVSQITHFDNLFNARTRNPLAATVQLDLSRWDVSNARYMHDMFLDATLIDFDVSSWQVSNVLHFNGMFEGATSFQGFGLEQWDVSQGRLFMSMFAQIQSLHPSVDLRDWNLRNAERLNNMFRDSNFGSSSVDDNNFLDTTIIRNNALDISMKDATHNLCEWMQIIPLNAETDGMFAGSDCPDTNDPDLLSLATMDTTISFCTPCTEILPRLTDPPRPEPPSSDHRPNVLFSKFQTRFVVFVKPKTPSVADSLFFLNRSYGRSDEVRYDKKCPR
jgi:hypothetical protein